MDKVKNIAIKHSSKLKYLFLCGAIIAAINTLSRADYNFVIYIYMFYIWTFMGDLAEVQRQDKVGSFYILLYSFILDFIWCLFWGGKWDQVPTFFHSMTLFFSWIGIVWKIFVILGVGVLEFDMIKASFKAIFKKKEYPNLAEEDDENKEDENKNAF